MTTAQIEEYANEKWGTDQARVIGDRIAGNRTASAVIDGNGNFMPLTWAPGDGYQPTAPTCGDHGCDSDCNTCVLRDILNA